jgi:hypothetical protein
MRTILAILAALAIAATARAETEALVTDTNGGVISGRSGALEFTNDIRLVSVSGDGAQFIYTDDDGNIASAQSGPPDLFDNLKTSLALPSWATTTNASNARTNIGLGGTNTPTFAGLTLTTLTNATPQVVLADTNGTLSTGSVPSVGAPEGAALQADGSGSSAFVASAVQARIKTSDTSITNSTNWTQDPHFTNYVIAANTTYRVDISLPYTAPSSGGLKVRIAGPAVGTWGGVVHRGIIANESGGNTIVTTSGSQNLLVADRANASTTSGWTGSFIVAGASGGTVNVEWGQSVANTNPTTILSDAVFTLTRISP